MEMYAVLGLELGQKIFEKLQKVEEAVDSLDIFARQKARELNPNIPDTDSITKAPETPLPSTPPA
jgi:predicted CoA-binding protein